MDANEGSVIIDTHPDQKMVRLHTRQLLEVVREEAHLRGLFLNTVVLNARAKWVDIHETLLSLRTRALADDAAADAQRAVLEGYRNDGRNTELIRPLDAVLYHGMEHYPAPRSPTRRRGHPIAALRGVITTTPEALEACSSRMVDYGHPREVLRAISDCAGVCGEGLNPTTIDSPRRDTTPRNNNTADVTHHLTLRDQVQQEEEGGTSSSPPPSTLEKLTPFMRIKARAAAQLHNRLQQQIRSASKHDNRRQDIDLKALHNHSFPKGMSHASRIIALQKFKTVERRVTHLGPLVRGQSAGSTQSSQQQGYCTVDDVGDSVDGGGAAFPEREATVGGIPEESNSDSGDDLEGDRNDKKSSLNLDPDLEGAVAAAVVATAESQHSSVAPSQVPPSVTANSSSSTLPRTTNNGPSNTLYASAYNINKGNAEGSQRGRTPVWMRTARRSPSRKRRSLDTPATASTKTGCTPDEYLSPVHRAVLERYRRVRNESTDTPTARLLNDPRYVFSTKAKEEMFTIMYLTATSEQQRKANVMKKEAIAAIKRHHKNYVKRQVAGLEQ